jgi:glucuronoarabinoxylan endo-1,4-beta-xylanase
VNWDEVHQRIDGFGACSAWYAKDISEAQADMFFSTSSVSALVPAEAGVRKLNSVGLSLLRTRIKSNGTTEEWETMKKAQARGVRIWSAAWTPPADWKDNHSLTNGGHLLREHYADYANQLANYVLDMNKRGLSLYAISVQNESDTGGSYESCQWTGQEMHDFIPLLSAALAKKGVASTKIMLPENVHWGSATNHYQTTLEDTNVAPSVGIIGIHNYDGRDRSHGATIPPVRLPTYDKPLWQTEVSTADSFDGGIANGIYWAVRIHQFLTKAEANAWHYWWLIPSKSDNQGLTDTNGIPAKRMFVLGNFSKFVRPGFVRVGVTGDTEGVMVSAYRDPNSANFVIVAINPRARDVKINFTLPHFLRLGASREYSPDSVTPWITSGNLSLADVPDVVITNSSFTYSLPAMSVVSFTGHSRPARVARSG